MQHPGRKLDEAELVSLLPGTAVWLFMALFVPAYRAAYPGWELFQTWLGWLWPNAFYSFAFVTIGFAIVGKMNLPAKWGQTWSLRKLPPFRDALKIPRGSSVGYALSALLILRRLFSFNTLQRRQENTHGSAQ